LIFIRLNSFNSVEIRAPEFLKFLG